MRRLIPLTLALAAVTPMAAQEGDRREPAFTWDARDPRIGLRAGLHDAGEAAWNLRRVASVPKPDGFFNPANPGDFAFATSDLAFRDQYLFQGNFHGFLIYDISNPRAPQLVSMTHCPGGQGDLSVWGNLLFMSVEQTLGRADCGTQGVQDTVSGERFRGIRIFDISDVSAPRQIGLVQTCRGSHTHTLVPHPEDDETVYIYVSGTGGVRSPRELPGCSRLGPDEDPNTSLFRIEVIQVPLAAPQNARVIAEPRIFADSAGNIAGLWQGGDYGPGTQRSSRTHQCHDITAYPAMGLAAGACAGNGILLDISNPANPVRIFEVADPNFAYWHSATFNNDASTVIYTDEWGGGTQPRCRETDPPTWGANANFRLENRRLELAGYFKLPVPQTSLENCVAHNGSVIPVPGRDLMVQAWYQGGLTIIDFTDPAHTTEVAFFDRGPLSDSAMVLSGFWSTYWYNGFMYGAEIARGLDVFQLSPSDHLSANEIAAAAAVQMDVFNAQTQPHITWPAIPVVAHAYLDQLARSQSLPRNRINQLRQMADRGNATQRQQAATQLERDAGSAPAVDARRMRGLAETLRGLP
ncbi:MAG: hypothetical protein WD934_11050 [Gemmatimonadales bacterium]